MLCPLFFLLKISEGKIGTANPPLSANVKRFDLNCRYVQFSQNVGYVCLICNFR